MLQCLYLGNKLLPIWEAIYLKENDNTPICEHIFVRPAAGNPNMNILN
jgi:hypothetical protein